jgi:threonine/homoserine efflux transporter RhtA
MVVLAIVVALGFPGGFIFAFFESKVENDILTNVLSVVCGGVSLLFWLGVRNTKLGFSITEWYLKIAMDFLEFGRIL